MFRAVFIAVLFCLMGLTQACFAAVSLSVNPADGSNSLRFNRVPNAQMDNKEEIHIRINSSNGGQYQVFQRILEPIENEKGDALNLQAIGTQTLSNSNSSGTLYLQNSDHLSMGDQLLYSSSQEGTSDSFIIGYSLDRSLINASGSFRGRLVFTVRGMGNASSDQVTIDVFLETSPSLKVMIKAARQSNRVHIQGTDTSEKTADSVNISFSGNTGQEIRIYQEIESMPQNETEEELGTDVIQLDAQGQTEGLRIQDPGRLNPGRTLIYSSNKDEDDFIIYFLVNPEQIQTQDAGSYVGRIKYIVQTDQNSQEFPMGLQFDLPPVFTMNVTTPPGGVSFSHVLANSPPQDKEVLVTVLSNLHKPYQVIQDLQSDMTNSQGKQFDSRYFNVQVEIPPGQRGQTDFVEFSQVKTGEYPIYSSDAKGSGVTFKVEYRLQGYDQMSPGDFLAPIRLSLNQK